MRKFSEADLVRQFEMLIQLQRQAENVPQLRLQVLAGWEEFLQLPQVASQPYLRASAQVNLANAYLSLYEITNDQRFAQRAEHLLKEALIFFNRSEYPEEWATTQYALGNLYSSRYDRTSNIADADKAEEYYRTVIDATKDSHLASIYPFRSASALTSLYFHKSEWAKAIEAYRYAKAALDELYRIQVFVKSKEVWLREARNLHSFGAYAFAKQGDLHDAVVTLERGRARLLGEVLARERSNLDEVRKIDPEAYEAYREAVVQISRLERVSIAEPDEARKAHMQLQEAIERIRKIPGYEGFLSEPEFKDVAEAVEPGFPLVYLATTPSGSLALICYCDSNGDTLAIKPVWADKFTEAHLRELLVGPDGTEGLGGWFGAYVHWLNLRDSNSRDEWFKVVERTTEKLWDLLMGAVVEELKRLGVQQAVLIPAGRLALLPLHAAWTSQNGRRTYALDLIAFSYSPSARALTYARSIAERTGAEKLLAIDEPKTVSASPLLNSYAEVSAVASHFTYAKIFRHNECKRDAILKALLEAQVAHFSCHGGSDWANPLQSSLLMANDELLTVQDIFSLRFKGARLAVLSACETGIIGTQLPDEVVMLPTAFMQAGFAGVVASLWAVPDLSTAMLMEHFYHLWRKEVQQPCIALRNAQQWLRDTTNQEKGEYFKRYISEMAGTRMPEPAAATLYSSVMIQMPDSRDFEHPYYWAAFYLTGM